MRSWLLLVTLGFVGAASACDGGVRARAGLGGATGSVGGTAGSAAGGSGGSGGFGGSSPLTECAIVHEIVVPSSPLVLTSSIYLTRAGEGFVLQGFRGADMPPSLSFTYLDPDGTNREVTTAVPPTKAYGWGMAGKVRAGDQMLMIASDELGVPPEAHVVARALDTGAAEFGPAHPLFTATVTNQTGQAATDVSLDGLRSIFAIGSPTLGQPVVALVGADGVLLGQPLTIATTAKDFGWRDLQVVATAHGGAVSVMDDLDGKPWWHVAELDGAGTVTLDAAFPLPEPLAGAATPRLLRPTPRGLVALFQAYFDGPSTLVEVDRTGSATGGPAITRVSPLFSNAELLGLAPFGSDYLVALSELNITKLRIVRVGPTGAGPEVTLSLSGLESRPAWIPAEDGGLTFVYRTSDGLSIVKVGCPP